MASTASKDENSGYGGDRPVRFSETLTNLIETRGYGRRRRDVAAAVYVTTSALSQYENGSSRPSLQVLADLAVFFDVSLDHLVFGERRIAEPEPDYEPLTRFVDHALAGLQARTVRHREVVDRIGNELGRQLDLLVDMRLKNSEDASIAGLLYNDEALIIEHYAVMSSFILYDLRYDIIILDDDQTAAPGRFFDTTVANIDRQRLQRVVLPSSSRDSWEPLVARLRRMLIERSSEDLVSQYWQLREYEGPLIPGMGLHQLDLGELRRQRPMLCNQLEAFISADWIGYVIPPSRDLAADALMDDFHLENAKRQFDVIWRTATPL